MNDEANVTKEQLLNDIRQGWERLQAFMGAYSEEQLTGKTDAAGWTAKDHLMHLSIWQGSMTAALNQQSRQGYMEISNEDWATLRETYDVVNGILQQRYKDLPLAEVRQALQARHEEFLARVEALTQDELMLPYKHFQATSSSETPIFEYISGNSYHHYDEHIGWMRAILD